MAWPADIIRPRGGNAALRLAALGLALVLSAGGLAARAETAPSQHKRVLVTEVKPKPPAPEPSRVDRNPSPWTGDLDGMKDRQIIRILVPYSKTLFFYD